MERIYFEKIKEKYDHYFVEYSPPNPEGLFAWMSLVYIKKVEPAQVVKDMEEQSAYWFNKYPVAIMAGAYNSCGDSIDLVGVKPKQHLVSLMEDGKLRHYWELVEDSRFPNNVLNIESLLEIYRDVQYKTQHDIDIKIKEKAKNTRIFKRLLMFWAVFVPLIIAVLEFLSPSWVAVLALVYSFWKAYQEWLKMTGRKHPSKKEVEEQEEKRLMEHHHYHCKLNQEGFARLRNENFREMEQNENKAEHEKLPKNN